MRKIVFVLVLGLVAGLCLGAATEPAEDVRAPHTPTLVYYLTGVSGEDAGAIKGEIGKEKSASVVEVNGGRGFVRVRFDSHVVSYHQIAQALTDAGKTVGKTYDPVLVFIVPGYMSKAKELDALFGGKRLNQRVHIVAVDKVKGVFAVHFLPLVVDAKDASPQGFNGGHLHHPVSDPAPRGLALPSGYVEKDDPGVYPVGAGTAPATVPAK